MKPVKLRATALMLSVLALNAMPTVSLADWTEGLQDQRCDPETADALSEALRNAIEGSVRRAEAAILPPTPVGDLGCLNDLMTAPIDTFSGVGGMLGALSGGLGNFDPSSMNLDIDVSGMICQAAAEKWATLTEPLSQFDADIPDYAGMASSAGDRLAQGGISFVPGVNGSSNYVDSTGSAGGTGQVIIDDDENQAGTGSGSANASSVRNYIPQPAQSTVPAAPPTPAAPQSGTAQSGSGRSQTSGNAIWDSLGN